MNEGKTISEQMNDIVNEICDRYCKYPEIAKMETDDPDLVDDLLYGKYCGSCPLNRI